MTVLENVLVACENTRKAHLGAALLRSPLFFRDEAEMHGGHEAAGDLQARRWPTSTSTSLSYGNQRRLEIARAMMLKPKLLLLDEPAAGMNYGEAEGLKEQIRWLRDEFKITVMLVEHNMQVVMGVCEDIHVLDHGETIAHGTPARSRSTQGARRVPGRRKTKAAAVAEAAVVKTSHPTRPSPKTPTARTCSRREGARGRRTAASRR
jgi:branched-chain amino acid transport system ATP-binding protein